MPFYSETETDHMSDRIPITRAALMTHFCWKDTLKYRGLRQLFIGGLGPQGAVKGKNKIEGFL
jgi:hypothetical protein